MSLERYRQIVADVWSLGQTFTRRTGDSLRILRPLPAIVAGALQAATWRNGKKSIHAKEENTPFGNGKNPLEHYFQSHRTGRGILKWWHYFDIYHRYFQKFVGQEVHVLEIGIFSGGSLEMWKEYFGPKCRMYGVDIEAACKTYEDERTKVMIGDQGDPAFWKSFKKMVPRIDVVIDDGGHLPEQQIVTLEALLPYMEPGGVFLCEDIHGIHHKFAAYLYGLSDRLNEYEVTVDGGAVNPTEFQRAIHAVHLHPYVAVIEKADSVVERFACPRHGTEWQPFR